MKRFTVWINACRLRTLPLAAASIIVAGGLAIHQQVFNSSVFILSLLTALLLQVLSNLANDYGDALSGADDQHRVGPARAMQSGLITRATMKKAIIVMTIACLISGLSLLSVALSDNLHQWFIFLGLGCAAIFAAITYTMGKLPYGYRAMGDIAVFIFFGLLGVLGSFYLQAQMLTYTLILPAMSIGLLSATVLNMNNMRDIYSDKLANKITLAVLLGRKNALKYHLFLISAAMLCSTLYIYLLPESHAWQYLFLLIMSPLAKSTLKIADAVKKDARDGEVFNLELKNMAICTFVFSILLALVLIT